MNGINFEIPNVYDVTVKKILANISIEKYSFKISNDEVILENGKNLFEECGDIVQSLLTDKKYYIVSFALFAFKKGDRQIPINNYSEFLSSKCEFALLICDNIVSFYSKNKNITTTVFKNAQINHYQRIELITDENNYFKESFVF